MKRKPEWDTISEDHARAILHECEYNKEAIDFYILELKKNGYIKKSAKEEAREYYKNLFDYRGKNDYKFCEVGDIVGLYEKAIKEAEEKNDNS